MRGYGLEGRYETLTPLAARLRAGAGQHLKNGISFDDPDLTDFGYDGLYVAVNLSCSHGLLFLNETFLMVRPHMHPPPPSAARDSPPPPATSALALPRPPFPSLAAVPGLTGPGCGSAEPAGRASSRRCAGPRRA